MQGDGAVIVILTGVETLGLIASRDDQVKRRHSKIELSALSAATNGHAMEGRSRPSAIGPIPLPR